MFYNSPQMNLQISPESFYKVLPFVILDLVLKGFALWKSAQLRQTVWFIALLIINSMGILPAIYLLLNRGTEMPAKMSSKTVSAKKKK